MEWLTVVGGLVSLCLYLLKLWYGSKPEDLSPEARQALAVARRIDAEKREAARLIGAGQGRKLGDFVGSLASRLKSLRGVRVQPPDPGADRDANEARPNGAVRLPGDVER